MRVRLGALLPAGDAVARVDDQVILAPCDGVLAALDRQPDLFRSTFRRLAQ